MSTITLRDIKNRIERDDLSAVQAVYEDLCTDNDVTEIDWTTLFKDCYLHACLKKKPRIAAWFEELFKEFDPIQKIALRQIFSYGRYLLRK
jgi:hypothetical protein